MNICKINIFYLLILLAILVSEKIVSQTTKRYDLSIYLDKVKCLRTNELPFDNDEDIGGKVYLQFYRAPWSEFNVINTFGSENADFITGPIEPTCYFINKDKERLIKLVKNQEYISRGGSVCWLRKGLSFDNLMKYELGVGAHLVDFKVNPLENNNEVTRFDYCAECPRNLKRYIIKLSSFSSKIRNKTSGSLTIPQEFQYYETSSINSGAKLSVVFHLKIDVKPFWDCSRAELLPANSLINGSTLNGNNFINEYGSAPTITIANMSGKEKPYRYRHNGGRITIELRSATTGLKAILLGSCGEPGRTSFSFSADVNTVKTENLPAGEYIIYIDGFNGAQGNFTIMVR